MNPNGGCYRFSSPRRELTIDDRKEFAMNTNKLLWSSLLAVILAVPVTVSAQYDRRQIERGDVQGLEGRWYFNGERDKPCEISFSRRGLQAKNEQGHTTRLER